MSDQPSSSRVTVGGVADSGEESHEAAYGAARDSDRAAPRDTTADFPSSHDGKGSPVHAAPDQADIQIRGRFDSDLDEVELDPLPSPDKPRPVERTAVQDEPPRVHAKRKGQESEQGALPPQQPTHEDPPPPRDTRPQVDPAPTDDGQTTFSALESPTSQTTIPRPGAYRMLPGRPSQRATSADSAVNTTASDDEAVSTEDGTVLVEASLVVEGEDTRPREPLTPLVEATPIRRRRQIAFIGIAVVLVVAIIVGIVTGLRSDLPPSTPVPPPTISPTSNPGALFIQTLPPYTRDAIRNPSSPQARAFRWVSYNDTVHRRDEPDDTNQRLVRMLQRFALATLYFSTSGETAWQERRSWLNTTGSECEWWGLCCGPECKLFKYDSSANDYFGNESDSTVLTGVFLSDNNLVGTLPREIWLLQDLQRLHLNKNTIKASIPSQVSNLSALEALCVEDVDVTSSLPTQLGLMTNLLDLSLGGNDQDSAVTRTLPTELASLTALTRLHLYRLNLNSTLPSDLGKLTNLKSLRLDYNSFSGSIPSDWGNLVALTSLELLENRLNGTLPSGLGRLTRMTYLSLSYNEISGPIPEEIFHLTALTTFDLTYNYLTSTLPTLIGHLTSLHDVFLRENYLSGPIPTEIGLLSMLTLLALPYNEFNQTVPTQFGLLTRLDVLNLASNMLTGSIPSEIGSLTVLSSLVLTNNRLTSSLPTTLGQLTNLHELRINRNELSRSIPSEFGLMSNLDPSMPIRLGTNNLTGSVPNEFCQLAQAKSLSIYADCKEVVCNCSCTCTDEGTDDAYGASVQL